MSTQVIDVIAVTGPTYVKTPRGGYNTLEVAFKADGKVTGKKLVDFNDKAIFNQAKDLKPGDKVQVTSEKKGDFWQWTNITAATGESANQAAAETSSSEGGDSSGNETATAASSSRSATTGRGKVTGSNYETPAERALRQSHIRRQALLNTAVSMFGPTIVDAKTEQVIALAEELEQWVLKAPVA